MIVIKVNELGEVEGRREYENQMREEIGDV